MESSQGQSGIRIMEPASLLHSDDVFRLLVNQVGDYAIFLLTPQGEVASWNRGAERIKFYHPPEIIGKHFRVFYPPAEQASRKPEYELEVAAATGRFEDEGWRIRKDGSKFWANVIITALRDAQGKLVGYGKVTRDLTERRWAEEQLRILSQSLMAMQDEERGRIGRELHDSIGQYLAAVKMSLEGVFSDLTADLPRIRQEIGDSIPVVDQAIREVRTLSYLLYPPMLDEMGLPSAIRWHLEGFAKRSGISVTSEIDEARLPRAVELALFRVLQESLTNVHRHSKSASVHIRFSVNHKGAVLEVQDFGTGMSPDTSKLEDAAMGTMGVGIRGMAERMRHVGAELEIKSSASGTTIRASVPQSVIEQS